MENKMDKKDRVNITPLPCGIVRDLLPLVRDGVAGEESIKAVKEHLEECTECRDYTLPEEAESEKTDMQEKAGSDRIVARIRKRVYAGGLLLLIAGSIVGVAMTNNNAIFYNILLMPCIGALGYVLLGKRFYLSLAGLFSLSIVYSAAYELANSEPGIRLAEVISYSLYFAVIYTLMASLGVLLAFLLGVTFGKGKVKTNE